MKSGSLPGGGHANSSGCQDHELWLRLTTAYTARTHHHVTQHPTLGRRPGDAHA
jgi:hypothetical protein